MVPKIIRDYLGIKPGDMVVMELKELLSYARRIRRMSKIMWFSRASLL